MDLIGFIQVFNIVVIAIGTLLYMLGRSLTFSSSTSSSSGAADAAVEDNNDDDDVAIPPLPEKYDVFLSFRGEDTRPTFTSHLRAALERKKFETYIDDKLKPGDEIGPTLQKAIEKSRLSVIIFSKNYSTSTWCLSELVHILKCREKKGQMVVPIFYDINPSDVRKQKGSYADAFAQLEKRESMGKVLEWRNALTAAANLSGSDNSNKKGTEADLIEKLVEDISTKLKRETSYDLKGMVGIQSRIEQVESLLSNNDRKGVCTVGIWGMGGIGKTTLAKAVFKRLSSNFEASCLLNNVREKAEQTDGVDQLLKTLLRDILKEKNLSMDSTDVQKRLSRTKVLIVFDDVTDSRQLKDVAGDNLPYGDGSRIIVTSREWSVLLNVVRDEKYIYQLEELNTDDAFRLFQSHAFKDNSPRAEYTELSARVVKYAGGIPLALEILGSYFFPCKSKDEWKDALNKLKIFPSKKIQNVFKISYDRLEENEREIFLDIACFYKGMRIEYVKKMADFGQMHGGTMADIDQMHGGSCAADGIRVLRDRSLISIDSEQKTIDMHDLVQEMGWEIVRQQCLEEPGRRSRLFIDEDVYHVLKNNTGTEKVQAIFYNCSRIGEQNLDRADFIKMYNMRLLRVSSGGLCSNLETLSLPNSLRYLFWEGYPLKSLTSNFSPENLVELHMPESQVKELWNEPQRLVNLKVINLECSKNLTEVPNLFGSREIVQINLFRCESLVEIPGCFQHLHKLTNLNLGDCKRLKYLPEMPENIEFLNLHASGIQELPESVWSLEKIYYLDIGDCKDLRKLPSNRCKLKVSGFFDLQYCRSLDKVFELPRNISKLSLARCSRLVSLPTDICKLKSLKILDLCLCSELENFPEILEPMEQLKSLNLSGTAIKELQSSIEFLPALKTIDLRDCKKLSSIPESICKLKSLERLYLTGCSAFYEFPQILEPMEHLNFLSLKGTAVKKLPSSIGNLIGLETLDLDECRDLSVVPSGIYSSTNLKTLRFRDCRELKELPSGSIRLLSLEVLDLHGTPISEIPDGLVGSTSLQVLDLSGSMIRSIPASIKQASRLHTLGLIGCGYLENFPEILEPMEHLKSLNLSGTAIKELNSSIEFLPALKTIDLRYCKKLLSIPKSICKLKSLEKLDLESCYALYEFPEILEPMEHLKSLVLRSTAIKELHSSIEFLPALKTIDLRYCQKLLSIPKSICKLKSLEKLDLESCYAFYEFPQILEPMEHLNFLSLKGTAVKKLPSSIGNLIGLETLDLDECRDLSVVPSGIYSLTNLKTLRFRDCRELKEFSSGSIRLLSLEVLDLHGTRISEIPDGLVGSTSLQELDLSGSMIRSIPASIKQASRLHGLSLIGCEQLQSLPELPVQCDLEAQGCTSLKTVSSSRTALIQGWDKYTYFGDRNFLNCRKLDHNARSNIMDEAQLKFMREATNSSRKDYGKAWFGIICPGKEIPKWFSFRYQSEGSSVHIKLPPDCFRTGLLGFVLSAVVSCVSNCVEMCKITARCKVKSLGESHELFTSSFIGERNSRTLNDCCDDRQDHVYHRQDHVYMWYTAFISKEVAEICSPDVYKLENEASVEFRVEENLDSRYSSEKLEKCGICPLYAEDVEKFKLDRVFISGEPKIQEETREDEAWEASGSSYKNKANESDDESEASESSYTNKANESDNESEARKSR